MFSSYLIMNVFWAIFITVFLFLLGYGIKYLRGHFTRESINFKSFSTKVKYFNVEMNPAIQGVFAITMLSLIIFSMYTGFTYKSELRGYALPAIILFVLVLAIYFIWTVLSQIDEDMSEYYHNYQKVNEALNTKKEAEKSIEKTVLYKTNITSLINDFERQIRQVEDPEKFKLKDSLVIIDEFVSQQTKTINSYESEVIERFDKALEKYFEHKIVVKIILPKTKLDFEVDYNQVRSEVYDKYRKIFNDTLYILIETKKYKTSTIITGGLQILKDNNYAPTQDLIELILISIDNIEGSPRELVDYLVSRKIVELEELITYAINKKILWVFKSNLFESQDQLTTISERLVKENAYSLSVAFISNYFTELSEVLSFTEKIKEANKTLNLFNNYKKVMNVNATFYDESRVLENKLISLKNFFNGRRLSSEVKKSMQEISDVHKAYKNKDKIDTLYEQVKDKYDDLRLNSTQSLLMYSGVNEEDSLLDLIQASNLFNDLYNRLLIKDLVVASLLLYSLFIYNNEDEELYNEAINALKTTKEYAKQCEGMNLNLGFENHQLIGKKLLQEVVFVKEKNRLSNIVVLLEKERLTLDKLMTIS